MLLFANVSDSPFASRLDLNPTDYGLAGKPVTATAIRPDGTRVPLAIGAVQRAEVELAARSGVAWEIQLSDGR